MASHNIDEKSLFVKHFHSLIPLLKRTYRNFDSRVTSDQEFSNLYFVPDQYFGAADLSLLGSLRWNDFNHFWHPCKDK